VRVIRAFVLERGFFTHFIRGWSLESLIWTCLNILFQFIKNSIAIILPSSACESEIIGAEAVSNYIKRSVYTVFSWFHYVPAALQPWADSFCPSKNRDSSWSDILKQSHCYPSTGSSGPSVSMSYLIYKLNLSTGIEWGGLLVNSWLLFVDVFRDHLLYPLFPSPSNHSSLYFVGAQGCNLILGLWTSTLRPWNITSHFLLHPPKCDSFLFVFYGTKLQYPYDPAALWRSIESVLCSKQRELSIWASKTIL